MRIIYVAKHGSGGNDDEGAILHALRSLGHHVEPVRESAQIHHARVRGDLLLFHKLSDLGLVKRAKVKVKVFWYFDLVEWPDLSLAGRNKARMAWMKVMTPAVDLGFCTDGDWVAKDTSGKLVWLTQGADERVIGRGVEKGTIIPVLFTGISKGGGTGRVEWVGQMRSRLGAMFTHVEKGVHGKDMADLVASSQVVVAPNSPVTDRYWSNRVYNALGFGAFLIHPWCSGLAEQYVNGKELFLYRSIDELQGLVESYLQLSSSREMIAERGMLRTKKEHTYRHRCVEMLKVIKERLGVE